MKLSDCKLITSKEYLELKDPEFVGQTTIDKYGVYYMVWRVNGVLYKTRNIFEIKGDMANQFNESQDQDYMDCIEGLDPMGL